MADLHGVMGSEQGGVRPVLVIQNEMGNKFSPTVIVAAITSKQGKTNIPTHVKVFASEFGLPKDSIILLEQVRTIDKARLKNRIGFIDKKTLDDVDDAIAISMGLKKPNTNRKYTRKDVRFYN